MNLLPYLHVTLVSGYSKEKVLEIVASKTQPVHTDLILANPVFNGQVLKDGFRISMVVRTAQNALPLAIGKVEDTSLGSIIFLRLRLFPAGILYLRFSSLLCVLVAFIFLFLSQLLMAGIISLLIALANYVILTANFHHKAQETISLIERILSKSKE